MAQGGRRLNAKHFENMITDRGVPVLWERSQRCTCWEDVSGQPNYECKACNGFGLIYDAPIEESAILIMSLVMSKEFTPIGEYRMGDAVATIPHKKRLLEGTRPYYVPNPLYWIGEWDRIILQNTEFRSDEVVVHQTSYYGHEADTLRNTYVTRIRSIMSANPTTGAVKVYEPGVDYTLSGNKIEWLEGGIAPEPGETYSVQYFHRPIYVVHTHLPQHRDQDDQHFPKKVILRYKDVI